MKARIDTGMVFERHEMKYLLNSAQHEAVMQGLQGPMADAGYGRHTICSLYYDTDDYAVIRRCLERPTLKEKLRLRSYGVPGRQSTVYLELKKKLRGITYKRRVALGYGEAADYMDRGIPPLGQAQILGEIDWYKTRQQLAGKVVLCYDRIALAGTDDPQLRVTVDANVRWRDYTLALAGGDHGALLLPRGVRLMEVKTAGALPGWLVRLLAENRVYPTGFSKYGTVYQQFLTGKEAMRHVG